MGNTANLHPTEDNLPRTMSVRHGLQTQADTFSLGQNWTVSAGHLRFLLHPDFATRSFQPYPDPSLRFVCQNPSASSRSISCDFSWALQDKPPQNSLHLCLITLRDQTSKLGNQQTQTRPNQED